MLAIEIINQCNFNCYFCSAGNIKTKINILTLMDIKKLIPDIIKLNIEYLKLTPSRGEIFLHPEIYEILELFCNIKNIKIIEFHTNFSIIDIEKFKKIKNLKKINMLISYYGYLGEQEFIYQTKSLHFEKVEKNIELAKINNLKFILDPRTRNYDYININQNKKIIKNKSKLCFNLYCPRILSNGDFLVCSCSGDQHDINSDFIIGNINNHTLFDLYLNKKRYINFYLYNNKQLPEICKNCEAYDIKNFSPTINVLKNLAKIKKNWSTNDIL